MSTLKDEEITEDGIRKLVCQFYDNIRIHETLAPVFNRAIENNAWSAHLETMCKFWSSIMLKSGKYGGNPLMKHMALPRFDEGLFDDWLALFAETSHEIFEDRPAQLFQRASKNIARSFRYMMYEQAPPK